MNIRQLILQNGGRISVAVNERTGEKVECYFEDSYLVDLKTGKNLSSDYIFQHEVGLSRDALFFIGVLVGGIFGLIGVMIK